MKSKLKYRLEALQRAKKVADKTRRKKKKSNVSFFSKIKKGFLVRMVKQERL